MEILERINNFLNKWLVVVGGIAVLALMTLATGNVCFRIFGAPYRGAYELASFLGAVVTAFSLGYTQKRKGHIVVDILSETFSPAVKRVVDSVSYFITMIFFAIISWVICRWGLRIAASGEVSETLKIAYYPFILCVALGFAFLCLTLIMDFLSALLKKGGNPAS
ncbi:MAG: TRAP transporter small permease [Deltaproteobacteria bacterium]|jgi:TRAP-type C4-dicarboxylate transport system permease small subunit|nr:TRAP transporter small permease [Deltaproteobacteria bacterium]